MIWKHLVASLVLRLGLCLYAEYHDSTAEGQMPKYTDIDYEVFSDGAQYLAAGGSPYDRDTYRYTPLVAYLMLPNVLWHKMCGKLLLCFADVITGWFIYKMVSFDKQRRRSNATLAAMVWLYNPFTLAISSRGSFEPIQCCLVLLTLWMALQRRYAFYGFLWGLSVHMKMYTVIYGLPLYIWANPSYTADSGLIDMLIPNGPRLMFGIGSLLGFGIPTGYFYYEYGYKFLYETFLYHLSREDTQHNFSPLFYPLRLLSESPPPEPFDDSSAVLVKWVLCTSLTLLQGLFVIRAGFRYGATHLPFSLFAQTCHFVLLNKVATSQYFSWYLCLLPLVLHRLPFRPLAWAAIIAAWLGAQVLWLIQAHQWEFGGRDNLHLVFGASLIYVISHEMLVWVLSSRYDSTLQKDSAKAKAKIKIASATSPAATNKKRK